MSELVYDEEQRVQRVQRVVSHTDISDKPGITFTQVSPSHLGDIYTGGQTWTFSIELHQGDAEDVPDLHTPRVKFRHSVLEVRIKLRHSLLNGIHSY